MPSEFGMDPALMGHALEPGRVTFDEKMEVRKAIENAQIPFTYVSANCFAGYFAGNLCQMGTLTPPRDKVHLYGHGNTQGTYKLNSVHNLNFMHASVQVLYMYVEKSLPDHDDHLLLCNVCVVVFVDEDDVATYAIKAIDDPRTLNQTIYIRPPENILSQRELIEKWENLVGKKLEKKTISEHEFLASMKGKFTI